MCGRDNPQTLLTLGPFALVFSSCHQTSALLRSFFPQLIQFNSILSNKHLLNVSCQILFPFLVLGFPPLALQSGLSLS